MAKGKSGKSTRARDLPRARDDKQKSLGNAAGKARTKTRARPVEPVETAPPALNPIPSVPAENPVVATIPEPMSLSAALTAPPGPLVLADLGTRGGQIGPDSKKKAAKELAKLGERLGALQERLYAQAQGGAKPRVLLLLQGMDTAGKDGVVKHVVGLVNPGGVQLHSFKQPTAQELAHDFLWRIENAVPSAGMIGVFNRSQYEDVLIARVHDLVPRSQWSRRFAAINAFERRLVRQHTTLVKCFLHISPSRQRQRLAARLEDPTKYWKYNPADLTERARWDDYQLAYADVLNRCSTGGAPWYVVPSDRKWYRNWAVATLLIEALERIDPQYPAADFDVAAERERVAAS